MPWRGPSATRHGPSCAGNWTTNAPGGVVELTRFRLCWRIHGLLGLMVCCGLDGVRRCTSESTRWSAMSMRPRPSHAVPAMTSQVARAAFPTGCLAIRVRDALGELFDDAQFAGLFATRGRPALS